tara:strand:+ start:494 stop:661 length:168 start_codon:yes stop_codon:yes gene_type:complete
MWVLVWFQIINTDVNHYELGQFEDNSSCIRAKDDAKVLITATNTVTYCFQIKENT